MCYKSIHLWEGIHSYTSLILGTIENSNLAIEGFLASLHRSLLTFLFAFSGFTDNLKINNARDFQPTNFCRTISWRRLWEENFWNFIFLEFCNFFHRQRAEMVRTRSRVTSPGPQENRDASSNPHRDRQSAPAMQPSSVQHVQSMAAAMAELTRQN